MDEKVHGQRHGVFPCDNVYLLKPLSNHQAPSLFRELFLGIIKEIGSPLSRPLDFRFRFLEDYDGLSLARATRLSLCVSRHPVILHICPSAFCLRKSPSLVLCFSLSQCAVIVQQLERSCVPGRLGITTLWRCIVSSLFFLLVVPGSWHVVSERVRCSTINTIHHTPRKIPNIRQSVSYFESYTTMNDGMLYLVLVEPVQNALSIVQEFCIAPFANKLVNIATTAVGVAAVYVTRTPPSSFAVVCLCAR